jgi:hypothetical protein
MGHTVIRRLVQGITVLLAATMAAASLNDLISCGDIFAECPGTLMWYVTGWIAGHQSLALVLSLGYALAVVVLFGRQIPGTVRASIKANYALRATVLIAAAAIVLALATHFPGFAALLR